MSDLTAPENRFERSYDKLLEVYLPVRTPGGRRLLFESYCAPARSPRADAASGFASLPALLGALLAAVAGPASARAGRSRAGCARASASARRCSAARSMRPTSSGGASPATSTTASSRTSPASRSRSRPLPSGAARGRRHAREAAGQTRQAMRELRSLLVEIYPPDLQRAGLERGARRPRRAARVARHRRDVDVPRRPAAAAARPRRCSSAWRRKRCATSSSTHGARTSRCACASAATRAARRVRRRARVRRASGNATRTGTSGCSC